MFYPDFQMVYKVPQQSMILSKRSIHVPQQLHFNVSFCNIGVKPLPLMFFTHSQAVRAIESLKSVPAYK